MHLPQTSSRTDRQSRPLARIIAALGAVAVIALLVGCSHGRDEPAPQPQTIRSGSPDAKSCRGQCELTKGQCQQLQQNRAEACPQGAANAWAAYDLCIANAGRSCAAPTRCLDEDVNSCKREYTQCIKACGAIVAPRPGTGADTAVAPQGEKTTGGAPVAPPPGTGADTVTPAPVPPVAPPPGTRAKTGTSPKIDRTADVIPVAPPSGTVPATATAPQVETSAGSAPVAPPPGAGAGAASTPKIDKTAGGPPVATPPGAGADTVTPPKVDKTSGSAPLAPPPGAEADTGTPPKVETTAVVGAPVAPPPGTGADTGAPPKVDKTDGGAPVAPRPGNEAEAAPLPAAPAPAKVDNGGRTAG
ncbi:hypothetical protein [uncultured Thiodictyon sp.]|uniref:hypothetical protein n=1 Tax=uncultured Thiodictyon sp. TaxID=1846217 RepID=UPI0025E8BC83|nr:hypothetical protein [uncultured Thiodictyon sp.]